MEKPSYSEAEDILFYVIKYVLNALFFFLFTYKEFCIVWKNTFVFLKENFKKTDRFLPELVSRSISSAFNRTRT